VHGGAGNETIVKMYTLSIIGITIIITPDPFLEQRGDGA
jgi:hypothetical protein